MSIDPRLERAIIAELSLRDRRARRHAASGDRARVLAERLHVGHHDLLVHLRRVAFAVPSRFRPVAWLHHARELSPALSGLTAAGLSPPELRAVELLAYADPPVPGLSELARVRNIAEAPGTAGDLARIVAYAALGDRLAGAAGAGEGLSRMRLLLEPRGGG
jgi:hypothetical protein